MSPEEKEEIKKKPPFFINSSGDLFRLDLKKGFRKKISGEEISVGSFLAKKQGTFFLYIPFLNNDGKIPDEIVFFDQNQGFYRGRPISLIKEILFRIINVFFFFSRINYRQVITNNGFYHDFFLKIDWNRISLMDGSNLFFNVAKKEIFLKDSENKKKIKKTILDLIEIDNETRRGTCWRRYPEKIYNENSFLVNEDTGLTFFLNNLDFCGEEEQRLNELILNENTSILNNFTYEEKKEKKIIVFLSTGEEKSEEYFNLIEKKVNEYKDLIIIKLCPPKMLSQFYNTGSYKSIDNSSELIQADLGVNFSRFSWKPRNFSYFSSWFSLIGVDRSPLDFRPFSSKRKLSFDLNQMLRANSYLNFFIKKELVEKGFLPENIFLVGHRYDGGTLSLINYLSSEYELGGVSSFSPIFTDRYFDEEDFHFFSNEEFIRTFLKKKKIKIIISNSPSSEEIEIWKTPFKSSLSLFEKMKSLIPSSEGDKDKFIIFPDCENRDSFSVKNVFLLFSDSEKKQKNNEQNTEDKKGFLFFLFLPLIFVFLLKKIFDYNEKRKKK